MKRLLLPLSTALLMAPLAVFAKPNIGTINPVTATANTPVTLTAQVSSSIAIQSCKLYIDLEEVGPMSVSGGIASLSYTFQFGGSHIGFVFCRDAEGGIAAGDNTALNVNGALQNAQPFGDSTPNTSTPPPTSDRPLITPVPTAPQTPTPTANQTETPNPPETSYTRHLLKLACPANAGVDNPCKAVYYIGVDGKRHAFPNSRLFMTWYNNFDSVQEVSTSVLGQFTLGTNVQYRPGVRMVKFATDPKVYAVSRGGVLRWVKSEELARAFYGDNWNQKIDDIPDTFYTNYTFGADINSSSDYNPESEQNNSAE